MPPFYFCPSSKESEPSSTPIKIDPGRTNTPLTPDGKIVGNCPSPDQCVVKPQKDKEQETPNVTGIGKDGNPTPPWFVNQSLPQGTMFDKNQAPVEILFGDKKIGTVVWEDTLP